MSYLLSPVTGYVASFWKSESPKADHTLFGRSDSLQLATTQLATGALNQIISDNLPGCSLCKATLRETREEALSFHTELGETIIFSDEKTMTQWLSDKATVDIWQIKDLREGNSREYYMLQRQDKWGYDTFETRDELFDRLREDYGVFWKLEDQGTNQTSYFQFKTGLFGNHYVDVNHENLVCVANSLKLEGLNLPASPSYASGRTSWGKGIAACVIGGLLISAGHSWSSEQNTVSDAIAMMKGTIGPAAFKAVTTFATVAAMSRHEGGALPGAVLAGMMLLPKVVKGQSCPQLVGSYDTPGNARGVALSGNYAYVADFDVGGLQIIDVSTVTNPVRVGGYDTPSYAVGVAVSGNYAYVADYDVGGLQIIDVTNVTNPVRVGGYDTPGWAQNVALSGNFAYVADWAFGLQIIDVSNVTNPVRVGGYDTPGNARDVAVFGNFAYVGDYASGLQIIDVTNVTNPVRVGVYATPDRAVGVALSGNYAYVADYTSGLQIIDVTNKAAPVRVGGYDTPGTAWEVALSGNYAYVADTSSGLQIIDVSTVTNPVRVGGYATPGSAQDVAVSGNYAYVADQFSGLQIIDLACPTSSSSTSSITTSSTTSSTSLPPSSSTTTSSTTSSTSLPPSSSTTSSTTTSSTSLPPSSSTTTSSTTSSTSLPPSSSTTTPSTTSSTSLPPSSSTTTPSTTSSSLTTTEFQVSGGSALRWVVFKV